MSKLWESYNKAQELWDNRINASELDYKDDRDVETLYMGFEVDGYFQDEKKVNKMKAEMREALEKIAYEYSAIIQDFEEN